MGSTDYPCFSTLGFLRAIQEFSTDEEGRVIISLELEIESYEDAESIVNTKDDGYLYIELENIYFDPNKWDIEPQAARTSWTPYMGFVSFQKPWTCIHRTEWD